MIGGPGVIALSRRHSTPIFNAYFNASAKDTRLLLVVTRVSLRINGESAAAVRNERACIRTAACGENSRVESGGVGGGRGVFVTTQFIAFARIARPRIAVRDVTEA